LERLQSYDFILSLLKNKKVLFNFEKKILCEISRRWLKTQKINFEYDKDLEYSIKKASIALIFLTIKKSFFGTFWVIVTGIFCVIF